jgi:enterochelin esterase-like enzyme
MKISRLIILFSLVSFSLSSQTFTRFVQHLNSLPLLERQPAADSFVRQNPRFPCIDSDTSVWFLYRVPPQHVSILSDTVINVTLQNTPKTVSVAGDFTFWQPTLPMTRISGTNLWYAGASFEPDARLDYKIVINEKAWILDPGNPYICTGGFGPNSELRMPKYILPEGLAPDPSIPHGIILDTTIRSLELGSTRTVKIYLPPGYGNSLKEYPVILFHDGSDYITLGFADNLLDWLIFHHEIEPVIGIFTDPVQREDEYSGKKTEAFSRFIVSELMPMMQKKYRITTDPHKRATIGASLGGNIALYLGITNPGCFGEIAAQSSSVSKDVSHLYSKSKKQDLSIYMDVGNYDLYQIMPMVHNFIPVLKEKKYAYRFFEFHEGHSWGSWNAHLNLILKQFFPYN